MKCPICENEMKKKSRYICVIWDQIDGDSEYRLDVSYSCKNNHQAIKYNEYDDAWEIPEEYRPTIKQIRCVQNIINQTGEYPSIPTKQCYWAFINEHISKIKEN